jgi:ribonuclease HII
MKSVLNNALIVGIDEAGRGPWTGSVFAAAVVLDPTQPILGLNDSKKLSAAKREVLALEIQAKALAWGVASASSQEVDAVNILQATFFAMRRALACLPQTLRQSCHAWVDGNRDPQLGMLTTTIVKGDATVPAISAASILAKVARDAESHTMHLAHPHFGFDRHKGYGTALHRDSLARYGPLPSHRRSFAPVAQWYAAQAKGGL